MTYTGDSSVSSYGLRRCPPRLSISSSLRGLEQLRPRVLSRGRLAIGLQRLACLVTEVLGDDHLYGDQQVAAGAVLTGRALATGPHRASVGGTGRQFQRHR